MLLDAPRDLGLPFFQFARLLVAFVASNSPAE